MRATLLAFWFICVLPAPGQGQGRKTPYDLETPDINVVRELVRDAAKNVETRYNGIHEEARELSQRVEGILALPDPPKAVPNQDARARLKAAMTQVIFGFALSGSDLGTTFRGYELDKSDAARRLRLRVLAGTAASGVQAWEREAELADLTDRLDLATESTQHLENLASLCRAHIQAHPKDAQGLAMLADALLRLKDLPAAEAVARQALSLEKGNLRARLVLLQHDCLRWMNNSIGLNAHNEPSSQAAQLERLTKIPLMDEDFARLEADGKKLIARAEALSSDTSDDLILMLRSVRMIGWVLTKIKQAEISRRPNAPRNIQGLNALISLESPPYFPNRTTLERALQLADKNIEIYGSVFLFWLKDVSVLRLVNPADAAQGSKEAASATMRMSDTTSGKRQESNYEAKLDIGPENQQVADKCLAHLQEWLKTSTGIEKARIHEVLYRAQLLGLLGSRFKLDATHLIEALRADPERHSMWGLLIAVNEGAWEDSRLTAAMLELQLALDPTLRQRRFCAAFTGRLGQWQHAEALMDKCLQETPDDPLLWNQKAVLSLRQDSSDGGLKKAGALFEKAKDALRGKNRSLDEELLLLVKNSILFEAMQGRWDVALETAESYQKNKFMPEDEAATLIKTLRESQPVK